MSDSNSTSRFCKKCQAETERNARGECKPCQRARCAAWVKANPEKSKAASAAWRNANPEKVKTYGAAWRLENPDEHQARLAEWRSANKSRMNASSRAWREAHLERAKATTAAWQKANPESKRISEQNRRGRKNDRGGALSKGLPKKLFRLQKGKCACCQEPLGDNYHLDHIMPLALGGSNTDDNMQLLRQRCNGQKGVKHPVEFMQERGFLL